MADDALGCELGEGDLANQLRLHPMGSARFRSRYRRSGLGARDPLEPLQQILLDLVEKPVPTLPA